MTHIHTYTHTPINRLWSPLAYGLGGNNRLWSPLAYGLGGNNRLWSPSAYGLGGNNRYVLVFLLLHQHYGQRGAKLRIDLLVASTWLEMALMVTRK